MPDRPPLQYYELGATSTALPDEVLEVIETLRDKLRGDVGTKQLGAVVVATFDAPDARQVLGDLGIDLEQLEPGLLEFLDRHPLGKLVVAQVPGETSRSWVMPGLGDARNN